MQGLHLDNIFDLGRNISGVIRIKVNGECGTILRLTHAEKLDSNGKIDQSRTARHVENDCLQEI